MHFTQNYEICCDGDLDAHVGTRDVTVWATGKTPSSVSKNAKPLPNRLKWSSKFTARTHWVAALCSGGTDFFLQVDSLEDDVCIGRPQTVRTERKIQEVATLVRANRSQSVDEHAAAIGVKPW